MSKKLLPALLIICCFSASAQEYSGTWVGVFNSYTSNSVPRISHFSMQLQQEGKAVWGVYTTGDVMTIQKADCACRVNGQLGKSKNALVLYKDGVIQSTISEETCDIVNYLEMQFVQKANQTYLTGKWFGNNTNSSNPDGASGNFSVQKVSDSVNINVSSYFPKLKKLVEKANR